MKKVTWILRYMNILSERNTLVLGTATKKIPCVELALSLMIYGNTWFLKNRREPNVSWSFVWSLLIFLSVLQPTSRWSLRIRSKDYTSGSLLRYVILTAAIMYISSLNLVIGLWLWLEHTVCTSQSHNWQLEQLLTHFGSSWACKRCCWDIFWAGKGYQQSKPLSTDTHACYLTQSSWNLQHWKSYIASILSTKWATFSSFDTDSMTSWFSVFQCSRRISWSNEIPCRHYE